MPRKPVQPRYLDLDLIPYAGRYLALVGGRVVAVDDSAEAAETRAKAARPQRPAIILRIAPERFTRKIGSV